jgi:hypothetical protein
MIRLKCNKCGKDLELDDAFAGGVCRCGTCGSIQHVPRELKGTAAEIRVTDTHSVDVETRRRTIFIVVGGAVAVIVVVLVVLWGFR